MSTEIQNAIDFFIYTFMELAILFVVISFIVSLIGYYLPTEKVKALLSGKKGYGTAISLGAVTPFCSCSTLPMVVGLLKARAQFGPVMAFLFTSPLVNPFIISLFWITFGPKITVLYTFFAVSMAFVSGVILQHFNFYRYVKNDIFGASGSDDALSCSDAASSCSTEKTEEKCQPEKQECQSVKQECQSVKQECQSEKQECGQVEKPSNDENIIWKLTVEAFNQFKSMVPYMAIGIAVGAVLHGFVPTSFFATLSENSIKLMIPLSAFVGVFLYVRASTMIPIASSLIAKGMSIGSVMSLTIAGAGASLPEMIMLKRLFRWPLLAAFISAVFITATITGFVIELVH